MKKPLELIIYPPLGPEPPQWKVGIGGVITHRRAVAAGEAAMKAKRFTDAELAAEGYRQMLRAVGESGMVPVFGGTEIVPGDAVTFGPIRQESERLMTIKRFSTLPHYDGMA